LASAPVVAVVGFEFVLETVTEPLVGLVAVTVNVTTSPALAVKPLVKACLLFAPVHCQKATTRAVSSDQVLIGIVQYVRT
jgi:hypothetical protein